MGTLQKYLRNLILCLLFNSHYESGLVMGLYGMDVSPHNNCKM